MLMVMTAVIVLAVAWLVAMIRVNQERREPVSWYRAWGSLGQLDVLLRPDQFNEEGQQWRRVVLGLDAALILMVLAVELFIL